MSGLEPATTDVQRLLRGEERLHWSSVGRRRPPTVGGIVAGLFKVALFGLFGAVSGALVWSLLVPSAPTDPFLDFRERAEIMGLIGLVVGVLVCRRSFVGSPPRGLAVTDQRALVVEVGRRTRIRVEQNLATLPFVARHHERGRRHLVWRVIRRSDEDHTSKRYLGLLDADIDLFEAERHVLLACNRGAAASASVDPPAPTPRAAPSSTEEFMHTLLHGDERLLWAEAATMPSVVKRFGPTVVTVIGVLFGTAFLATTYVLISTILREASWFEIAVRGFMAFVFLVMFLGSLALRKGLRVREADVAVYAVTTWRALIAVRDDRGEFAVTSYPPVSLGDLTIRTEAGHPVIQLTRHWVPHEGFLISQTRFNEVQDLRGAETALEELLGRPHWGHGGSGPGQRLE